MHDVLSPQLTHASGISGNLRAFSWASEGVSKPASRLSPARTIGSAHDSLCNMFDISKMLDITWAPAYCSKTISMKTPEKAAVVYDILASNILSGKWPVGECFPTEMELAASFNCARGTISRAVTRLIHEGLVERKKRAGTRVIRNSLTPKRSLPELNAFAFIYPSYKHESFWKIAQGFQQEANLVNRRSVFLSSGIDFQKEAEIISRLEEFDIRGAAVYLMISDPEDEIVLQRLLAEIRLPIVLIGHPISGCVCPVITQDYFYIGYTMTRHMIETGSRRIGFLANGSLQQTRRDMYKGYLWALDEVGISENRSLIKMEYSMQPDFNEPLNAPLLLGHRYLEETRNVEAVVCADDHLAQGLIRAGQERGMNIPKDLKVTGSDDFAIDSSAQLSLTTYRISPEAIGGAAFRTLCQIANRSDDVPQEIRIRGEIVIGESA